MTLRSMMMIMMMVVTTMSMSMMKVEAFGGLSARNHVISVAPSCSSSPFMRLPSTGRACKPTKNNRQQFQMSSNGDDAQKDTTDTTAADAQSNDLYEDGGDLYDDEVAPYENQLSDSMRSRLMKEASSGLDSEVKSTNSILYIGAAIAVLVVLGGKGILY